jgi:glycine cleavage system H protein
LISYDSETKIGRIHITDYAQSSLGDVVFVELPNIGTEVEQGGQLSSKIYTLAFDFISSLGLIGAVESVKAASDIVRI